MCNTRIFIYYHISIVGVTAAYSIMLRVCKIVIHVTIDECFGTTPQTYFFGRV
jgi:hypothetical protein